ncbi:MAG: DUF421 domain-containing protein [Acutalibacteraceae bacterium]|nr:DUF421 domain-containing protein [Acutalibacteraceae bacterium]
MFITVYRTIILYVVVIISIRLMGKRQIGDMQPGELVVTLLISEIAAMPLQDIDQPLLFGISAIFTLVTLEILVSLLSLKSFFLRKLMSGKSAILIKDGIIDQKGLKRVRMTVLDLVELLRAQQIFDIGTVSFAVLETGGNLSVLLKSGEQPATAKDVGAKNPPARLPMPVISDGKLLYESVNALGISEKLIDKSLKEKGLARSEVFLMTLDQNGNEEIVKKEKRT